MTIDEKDDKLSKFIALTGSDPGLARDLLDTNQWDLDAALSSFTTITVFRNHPPEITAHPAYSYHGGDPVNFRTHNILDRLPTPAPPTTRRRAGPGPAFKTFDLTPIDNDRLGQPPTTRSRDLSKMAADLTSFEGIERKISELQDSIRKPVMSARPVNTFRPDPVIKEATNAENSLYFPFYLPNVWTEFFIEHVKAGERQRFLKFFQDCILDKSVSKTLENSGKLNWWIRDLKSIDFALSKLWALSASGDGNCLLHAASLGVWGFNDKSLTLRKALYETLVNDASASGGSLWRRWRLMQTITNQQCDLVLNNREWDEEWEGIVTRASPFATNENRVAGNGAATKAIRPPGAPIKMDISYHDATQPPVDSNGAPKENGSRDVIDQLDRRRSSIVTEVPRTEEDDGKHRQSAVDHVLPIYHSLEEFHIYVLANVLRRPIIVISQSVLNDIEGQPLSPISFGGIYLPLEHPPESCRKSPLILAYEASHFSPLVLMAAPCAQSLTNSFGDAQINEDGESIIENGKTLSYYPVDIPLVDSNLEPLPIHFAMDPGPKVDWNNLPPVFSRQSFPPQSGSSPSTSSREHCSGDARGYLSDPPPIMTKVRKSSRSLWHRPLNSPQQAEDHGPSSLTLTHEQCAHLLERYMEIRYVDFEATSYHDPNGGRAKASKSHRRSSSCSRRAGCDVKEGGGENDWRENTGGLRAALKWPKRSDAARPKRQTWVRPMVVIRVYYKTIDGHYTDRADRFARKMLDRFRTTVVRPSPNASHKIADVTANDQSMGNVGYQLSNDFLRPPPPLKSRAAPFEENRPGNPSNSNGPQCPARERANTIDDKLERRTRNRVDKKKSKEPPPPPYSDIETLPPVAPTASIKTRSRSHHRHLVDKLSSKSVGALNELMNSVVGRGLLQKSAVNSLAPTPADSLRPGKTRDDKTGKTKFYEPTPVAYTYGHQNANNNNNSQHDSKSESPFPSLSVLDDSITNSNGVDWRRDSSISSSPSIETSRKGDKIGLGACLGSRPKILAQWIHNHAMGGACNPKGIFRGFKGSEYSREYNISEIQNSSLRDGYVSYASQFSVENTSLPPATDDWRENTGEVVEERRYRLLQVKSLSANSFANPQHSGLHRNSPTSNHYDSDKMHHIFAP